MGYGMGVRKLCLLLVALICETDLSFGQDGFESVANSEVMDCVLGFVANREKYKSFGCSIEMDSQIIRGVNANSHLGSAIVFEDEQKKLRRSDTKRVGFHTLGNDDLTTQSTIGTTFVSKGKSRFFEDGVERSQLSMERDIMFFFVPDPWMVAITEISLLDSGKDGGNNYWIQVLDESRLLWAESNGAHVRGEWKFGSGAGECYVQAYFDIQAMGGMPVLVRYIRPKDPKARFAKVGRTFVSENKILWKKLENGYVPIEVRNHREDYWESKSGIKGNDHHTIKFEWKSKLIDDEGNIDDRIFKPGIISFADAKASFLNRKK